MSKSVPKLYLALLVILAVGCAGQKYCGFKQKELEQSFVPMAGFTQRPSVSCDHVVFLDKEPTDRKFIDLGIIAPRDVKAKSWANAVQAARAAAALKGADAIFLVSEQDKEAWGFAFSNYGGHGGSKNYVTLRCKAIVWDDNK